MAGRALAKKHYVRALNRRPVEGVDCVQADISDLDAIRPAFEGIDTVVHMAAYLGPEFSGQVSGNLIGAYNVFEAAREAGGEAGDLWQFRCDADAVRGGRADQGDGRSAVG